MKVKEKRNERIRYNILTVFVLLVGIILLAQLFNLQIIHGKEYLETSNTRLTRESIVKAARGNITDSTGNKLVTTKMGFSLELYKTKIDVQTLNNTILSLVKLLEKNKDTYVDNLPIKIKPYAFKQEKEEEQKKWKKEMGIEENATAEETFIQLKEKYDIQEENVENARKIMAVRYEATIEGFSNIKPVTISKDISRKSANQIKEQGDKFPGTSLVTEPVIEYPYKNLASHLLGYVGKINSEEYKNNKDTYQMNDLIGRAGIQYTLEEYLKGKDGIRQIDMAVDGTITEEYISKEAVAGNNVTLTIDANLQKKVEDALKKNIKKIANGEIDGKKHNAKEGAAVVMNVKTGEVLALASYPDYEPELFAKGISQAKLKEYDKNSNTYNRAISSAYAPGSTFKMAVATAALETGAFTTQTLVTDSGPYSRGHHPVCWIYTDKHYGHGALNISDAIKHSCNIFFYEIGYRIGIDKIAEYAYQYGLGKKTGIELAGETTGIVASTKYKKETYNEEWQLGETLSAAIGQSYNSYTPIQMARYICMIANGGKAVDVSIIKSITDADGNSVSKQEISKKVNEKLGIKEEDTRIEDLKLKSETIEAIKKGMKGVTSEAGGTAYYVFSDLDMTIAGKTGSAETEEKSKVNGWYTGFAPYDNPEIAVVVFIENAGSGGNTALAAKEIMQEYFGMNAKKVNEDVTAIPNVLVYN
ncbi:MAG: penicillin-binding protein 2 [Clostridia bacterium]|nr:penicillin-binding protein 2 [Clostridia bacterium]